MRVIGVDLPRDGSGSLVVLSDDGRVSDSLPGVTLPQVAASVASVAGSDPFLLGINIPLVVSGKASRARPVESLLRRRFGVRLPPGGRAALSGQPGGVQGESLLAGLAAAGHPCLPYPDRDRRQSGMLETYPALVLKTLLWIDSPLADEREPEDQLALFRAYGPPAYRASSLGARSTWSEQAAGVDLVLRLLDGVEGLDLAPARSALRRAASTEEVERAASTLDATLVAGLARRYLEAPETCLFVGDRENGYVILPADSFVRSLASEARPSHGRLFPAASLRKRLGPKVKIRSADLLDIPGRPNRLEARFEDPPSYEFDNVDEMIWWKHTRHVAGTRLPTEGLTGLVVKLGAQGDSTPSLRLVRSRHATLSFRFEPPQAWRSRVPTRDGKTYAFRVLQATYQATPT